MAASGAPERRPRRGPAPIASFDHDVSDEVRQPSSPESKKPLRLPEIRETYSGIEARARSHSTPVVASSALPTPRIDISRASSSSPQDSRDSSPELALFEGTGECGGSRSRLELGFREDGALELRSSTEELAFLEGTGTEQIAPALTSRHHSRKDSQCSEAALLAVSGRTSRLSSVGSQGSAHSALSALSRVSRLSVTSGVSGVSRSPSPHRMLLETSFCGPRPIDTDPEICAAAVEDRLLEIAKMAALPDSRDHREIRTEVTVEIPRQHPVPPAPSPAPTLAPTSAPVDRIEAQPKERRPRLKLRREPSEPEVYKKGNRTKDVIRIKLKPDEDYGEEEETEYISEARAKRPTELAARSPPSPQSVRHLPVRDSRTPSPVGPPVSRKSSFCSLFKSRETIASPDLPSEALRRKRSLTEGGGRSKSRERSVTPISTGKLRGSVLSLFRPSRRSVASPAPTTRESSPIAQIPPIPGEQLKYYENTRDGIIHIPLRTPPEERANARRESSGDGGASPVCHPPRPASAPVARTATDSESEKVTRFVSKPTYRKVLPDGSIIIPLHSPTERVPAIEPPCSADDSLVDVVCLDTPPAGGRAAADGAEASPAHEPPTEPPSIPQPISSEDNLNRRRAVFTTRVGSREQVFSTQFSLTKSPSVTSEVSCSLPSSCAGTLPREEVGARDSSESEGSSDGTAARAGSDAERRGLVVQDSFEEELPYVPTTLPLERPVALPMVPVRERNRAGVRVVPLERPRAAAPLINRSSAGPRAPPPAVTDVPLTPAADKLRIRLPRTAPTRTRTRTRSGGDGAESRPKEWIDFEEVPERRKQPKRIETLPAAGAGQVADASAGGVVFSYVDPDQCRCECHGHAPAPDSLAQDILGCSATRDDL